MTTQPRTKKREIEEFVRDLDPVQVQGEPVSARACVRPDTAQKLAHPLGESPAPCLDVERSALVSFIFYLHTALLSLLAPLPVPSCRVVGA